MIGICFFYIFALVKVFIFSQNESLRMPYRRLPNTDVARIRAIQIALDPEPEQDGSNIPFSLALRLQLCAFQPRFRTAILNTRLTREKQMASAKKYAEYKRKARLYISHFLQVLNFTIIRGELKKTARSFYGLPENSSKLPSLLSDQEIIEWGEKVINGEQERVRNQAGTPIYSPSIALVKVHFENFKQHYFTQKQFQSSANRLGSEVSQLRQESDDLIQTLWNEIEAHYAHIENEEQRRLLCEKWGITYVFRKGEQEKLSRQQELDRITLKLPF